MACNDICIAFMQGTSRRVRYECMVRVNTVFGIRRYGKSTLCLVFDVYCEDMVNRHCVWYLMVSSIKWDMSKLRLTVAWHEKYVCKWVRQVGIGTPLGEKPGIWFRHETVGESP